jgi:hypothetical protein
MAKKPTVLTDSEIITRVLAKASDSVGWYDSKLSRERERVTQYYNGVLPKRTSDGSSSYVSTDVYDSTETSKAVLLETFAGGDDIAQFDPDGTMNADQCRAATAYASYVIFRENDGFGLFNNVIHDGLTARVGIAKVFWEEKYEYEDHTFEGLSHDEAHAVASHDSVDSFDGTHDPETNTYSGSLTRKKDCSKITCIPVPPEEFIIEPRAITLHHAKYCGHRTIKTKSELIEMGYKKSVVMKLRFDDPKNVDFSAEALARNAPVEAAIDSTDDPIQDELQAVLLYESYVWMQIDPAKGVLLYKICHVDDTILSKEEVDKVPFLAYVPLPIPHLFYGNNFAARVIPTQNARTVLMRGVLDHTAISTNPRWQVVNGGLMNPRELLENRMGGLVNVRRPDTVQPLQQNNLNPYVFNVMELLTSDKENSTGNSSLSMGLNKDAISTQNSQGLIDNMMKASGQRAKIAARNFAYNFFVPLMIEVIRLTILHEQPQKVIDVAGAQLTVNPQDWTERKTCSVSMHLGYGEKDKLAGTIAKTYEMFSKDPSIAPMFQTAQRYAMLMDGMKAARLPGAMNYLMTPDKVQPTQPDPIKMGELKVKQDLAQAALMQGQAANDKNEKLVAIDSERLNIDKHKLAITALDNDRNNDRHDLETAERIDIGQREIKLLEAAPPASEKAIVAPRN